MMYFHKGKDGVAELLDLRQTYLEDGKYEQAVASLEAILNINPKEEGEIFEKVKMITS